MRGLVPRRKIGATLRAALCAAAALIGPPATAAPLGTPLLGQAGAALVPGADTQEAMKQKLPQGAQKMADNFNKAGTGGAAPPAAGAPPAADGTAGGGTSSSAALPANLVKYAPSYVMMVLAISLGLFVVCRPAGFSLASLAEKKTPKK